MSKLSTTVKNVLAQTLSKRRFLSYSAAMAAFWGGGRTVRALAAEIDSWDVIVVGGGTAGLPAALFSAMRGANVLIIETGSALGGTLFMSSAMMSAAGTKLQKAKGIEDSPQRHYDDIMRISHGTADPNIVRLAVDNAAETFDWLTDNGMEVPDRYPILGPPHHDPYSVARYASGPEGGISVRHVLLEKMKPYIDNGSISVVLDTEVTELLQDADGRVTGVQTKARPGGATSQFFGRNIALTSGGYSANPSMIRELENRTDYSEISYPYSQGAGITLGRQAGGYVKGGEKFISGFGSVLRDFDYPSAWFCSARHWIPDRPPWEILVNVNGERFLQEDAPSYHEYEIALTNQQDHKCWIVFDDAILHEAPPLLRGNLVKGSFDAGRWTVERTKQAFDSETPMFYKGNTLEDLAEVAKIRSKGLVDTVARYNDAQKGRVDDEFGRTFMPKPIIKPPYYAVLIHGGSAITSAGLAVDKDLCVIRRDGTRIEGLYAAGELLGAGQLMGQSFCGGMTVTPSLTFGRLLGQSIFSW